MSTVDIRFVVTSDFFSTLRIPLVRGRLIDERDQQGRASVAVINRSMADTLFPGEDAVGHRIRLGPPDALPRTIVGIVADIRHRGLEALPGNQVYVPQPQWAWAETSMTLVIRAKSNPETLVGPIREILRTIDPQQPITNVQLYDAIVAESMATRRFAAGLLGIFAATALVLSIVGLYGALGVMVGQRSKEIALRIAIGARGQEIRRMVLRQGLKPVTAGLLIGLATAALSVGALRSMLHQTRPLDPVTFVAVAVLLSGCATIACLLPALRASRIDPAATLRGE